jgi:hypothetical protein
MKRPIVPCLSAPKARIGVRSGDPAFHGRVSPRRRSHHLRRWRTYQGLHLCVGCGRGQPSGDSRSWGALQRKVLQRLRRQALDVAPRPDAPSATSLSSTCVPACAKRSNGRLHWFELTGFERSIRPLGVLDPASAALAHGRNAEWAARMGPEFVRVWMLAWRQLVSPTLDALRHCTATAIFCRFTPDAMTTASCPSSSRSARCYGGPTLSGSTSGKRQ